jgi:hypothetical protein
MSEKAGERELKEGDSIELICSAATQTRFTDNRRILTCAVAFGFVQKRLSAALRYFATPAKATELVASSGLGSCTPVEMFGVFQCWVRFIDRKGKTWPTSPVASLRGTNPMVVAF